jgi:hypothetical protein
MKQLLPLALFSFASAVTLPVAAAEDAVRIGPGDAVEAGPVVSAAGPVRTASGGAVFYAIHYGPPRAGENAGAGIRTGDTQSRREN